jgi:hypothetical protein
MTIPDIQRLRNFDSALDIVRRIRSNVDADPAFAKRDELMEQLRLLVEFVENEALLNGAPQGSAGYSPINLGHLFVNLGNSTGAPKTRRAKFLSILDQLEELLQIRRTIFSGELRETTRQAVTGPAATEQTDDLKPDEAAALWKSAEKLYGSWPVRLLGALMIAAVFLAGAGTFFIGGQTLQLRQNLENTARAQTTSLEEIGKSTRAALDSQSANLKGDASRQQEQIAETLKKANEQVNALKDKSDGLLKDAVTQIANRMEGNFKSIEKDLSAKITGDLKSLADTDVAALRTKTEALKATIEGLETKVREGNTTIINGQPALARIAGLRSEMDALDGIAARIKGAESSATAAAGVAASARNSANIASDQAELTRKALSGKFDPISEEIGRHQHTLGSVQTLLEGLNKQIIEAELNSDKAKRVIEDTKRANAISEALDRRLEELKKRIADLEGRVPEKKPIEPVPPVPPPPTVSPVPPPAVEPQRTKQEWRRIQRALAGKGYSPGSIDGEPGPVDSASSNTRKAIRAYQTKEGPLPANGILTADQASALLRTR